MTGARVLRVFAAASLTEVYEQLATAFEQAWPDATVRCTFDGSDSLVDELGGGAVADVLATASTTTMRSAERAGSLDGASVPFATNTLQIAVAPGNPKNVRTLADLARPDVVDAVCAPTVPCGSAAAAAEEAAGVRFTPADEEQDVRSVLARVRRGEADAGLVYVTDVRSTGGAVEGLDFPEADAPGVRQHYRIAVVAGARDTELAGAWIELVTGPQGRDALTRAGFAVP